MNITRRVIAVAAALVAPAIVIPMGEASAIDGADLTTYISEFHYDNDGADAGEAVEVTGPAGTDLTGWKVVPYNGNGGAPYSEQALGGVLVDQGGGVGTAVVAVGGLQNGAPDGIALVDAAGAVVQFISYEGATTPLTPTSGPAVGLVPTDIGVTEDGSTQIGQSLQRSPSGVWTGPLCASFGAPNDPDAPEVCPIVVEADVTEFHYDNIGTDVGEAIEVRATAGVDLGGWSIVLYNGNGGAAYGTEQLSGVLGDDGDGFGTAVIPAVGLQNGSPDGFALVGPDGVDEFWSYEGTFVAADGPAAGMLSTDVGSGVFEPGTTPIGLSLQRNGDVWRGPACASFGEINDPAAPAECPIPPAVQFSEIHYDNAGTDVGEAIEVTGIAGTDLTGWSIVLYNGNGGAAYNTAALSGVLLDEGAGLGASYVAYPENGIQNGAPDGMALVDATGAVVEFLSYEGAFTAADGPAAGLASVDIGIAEGTDTVAGTSLQRDAAGDWSGPKCASFGEVNDPFELDVCPLEVKIHEVQGGGDASPLAGTRVIVEGVVVGDQEGPVPALRGFFVQEEDGEVDGDPATSEGVFVFNFDDNDVAVGDLVRVEGTVEEFFGNTQLGSFAEVEVLSSGNPLPAAADITFPVVSIAELERYEGMLATLTDTMVISEYFNYDRFGEIVVAKPVDGLGATRAMNPTAVYAPGDPAAAELRDINLRSRIIVDDGNSFQNPEINIHPINREPFSLDNSFRGGDTVTGLTGPIYYSFSRYRILPLGDYDADGANEGFADYTRNPAPAVPDDVGGELTVASLNALNYFVTVDPDPNPTGNTGPVYDICGPNQDQDCRGADDRDEFERQHAKLMNTLVGMDADVVGLIELENTFGVEALATIVDGEEGGLPGLNDLLGEGTYAYVAAGAESVVGTDAIKVGVIYKPASVTPYGAPAILDSPAFLDPLASGSDRNRAAVAQSFVENSSGEVFSVVVNHLKSKGSACGEPDEGGLTGSCNLTRAAAAGVLTDWLAGDPTGSGDADWLILGDLNSYDKEDPIVVLEGAGYTDLVGAYGGEFAYSYVFDGEVGYLDYILSNPSMTPQVTGATEWHVNADEPDIVDYDTGFKSDAQDAFFDPTTPYRSSDHDAAIVGLSLDSGFDATVTASPSSLWPPNHRLRSIQLLTSAPSVSATVTSATSSEADSGLGDDDVPNDIVITDGELQLRAERYAKEGRTYTVSAEVTDGSQVVIVDGVTVVVPHDQGSTKVPL